MTEDSENVLPLIENTVEDGNVIEEDHISVNDIVNNASGEALEKDHFEHNVVVNFNKESFLRFNLPPLHVVWCKLNCRKKRQCFFQK